MNIVFDLVSDYLTSPNDVESLRLVNKEQLSIKSISRNHDPYYLALSAVKKSSTSKHITLLADHPDVDRALWFMRKLDLNVRISFRNILYDDFKGVKIVDSQKVIVSIPLIFREFCPMSYRWYYYNSDKEKRKFIAQFSGCVVSSPFSGLPIQKAENVLIVDHCYYSAERMRYFLSQINNSYRCNSEIKIHYLISNRKCDTLSSKVLHLTVKKSI